MSDHKKSYNAILVLVFRFSLNIMIITTNDESIITLSETQILEWTICYFVSPDYGDKESLIMFRYYDGSSNTDE